MANMPMPPRTWDDSSLTADTFSSEGLIVGMTRRTRGASVAVGVQVGVTVGVEVVVGVGVSVAVDVAGRVFVLGRVLVA